jgi:hypothetical protein
MSKNEKNSFVCIYFLPFQDNSYNKQNLYCDDYLFVS